MAPPPKALRELPPYARTGIGSLPHVEPRAALQLGFEAHLPYLPQLPARSSAELMLAVALDGLPGVRVAADGTPGVDERAWRAGREALEASLDEAVAAGCFECFEPSAASSACFRPFLHEVEARRSALVKVQLAGPLTVERFVRLADGARLRERPELAAQVRRLTEAKALALVQAVRRVGATPVIFFDEPGLGADRGVEPSALRSIEVLVTALRREGAAVGLHCCAQADWSRVLALGLDVLSVDAGLSLDAVLRCSGWRAFFESGATLSLGLLPTAAGGASGVARGLESSLREAASSLGVSWPRLRERLWVTPACGLAGRSEADAEALLRQLSVVREALLRAG